MKYYSNYYGVMDMGDELYHYGVLGMKWGIRRYQNKDGSLTPLGRKKYGTAEGLNKAIKEKENARKAKQEQKEQRRADVEKKKEQKEKEKIQNAINNGDLKTISKYRANMSTNDLNAAILRANLYRQLDSLAPAKKGVFERVGDISAKVSKIGGSVAGAIETINRLKRAMDPPKTKSQEEITYEKAMSAQATAAAKQAREDARSKGASAKEEEAAVKRAFERIYNPDAYDRKEKERIDAERKKEDKTYEKKLKDTQRHMERVWKNMPKYQEEDRRKRIDKILFGHG